MGKRKNVWEEGAVLEAAASQGNGIQVSETMPDGTAVPTQEGRDKPEETKSQKFRRLAQRRVQKALDALAKLIPLANRSQYEYGEADVAQILDALRSQVESISRAFSGQAKERPTFQLR